MANIKGKLSLAIKVLPLTNDDDATNLRVNESRSSHNVQRSSHIKTE